MTIAAENLLSIIQTYWGLADPAAAQISFNNKRIDQKTFLSDITKTYAVTVFTKTTKQRAISLNWWRVDEQVQVDILVKVNAASAGTSLSAQFTRRNNMRDQVRTLVHRYQRSIPGVQFANIVAEPDLLELENLVRGTLFVNCLYFHQLT
jgi:hypothetical protein